MRPAGSGGPGTSASIQMSSVVPGFCGSGTCATASGCMKRPKCGGNVGAVGERLVLGDDDVGVDAELAKRAHDEPRAAAFVRRERRARRHDLAAAATEIDVGEDDAGGLLHGLTGRRDDLVDERARRTARLGGLGARVAEPRLSPTR